MTKRKTKTKAEPRPLVLIDFKPFTIERYGDPTYSVRRDADYHDAPSFVNQLDFRRYRVTVELIDEPIDVLRERLTQLWLTGERNSHHWDAFDEAAKELGMPPFDYQTHGSQRKVPR